MALIPVASGDLAAVVTCLEMRRRPEATPLSSSPLALTRLSRPDLARYRRLFRAVGAPWLWFSRLALDEVALAGIIHDPGVEVHVVTRADADVGLLELDFREPGSCALAYVGLVPALTGQGYGRWLLAHALRLAWRGDVDRVTVHTCTLDHPAALPAYRRAGFVEIGRAVETFADPRITGWLGPDDAPGVRVLS